jgi:hypothetical protein
MLEKRTNSTIPRLTAGLREFISPIQFLARAAWLA